ncbi:MAG: hypothetical protein BMS9Abin03_463 [Thermodesulfobacteriota bacterium]|nr:MAG: hypothetical protein BMS9Abin03_463 [Thermodesulfobacteriota bacterium]
MKVKLTKSIYLLRRFGKAVAVFLAGGIFVHLLVMLIDLYLMPEDLHLNLNSDFIGSMLSPAMFPMMAAYGFCMLGAYFSWIKMKDAMAQAYQKEIQRQETEEAILSIQRITGLLAQHLAAQNAEIMHWIEVRKKKVGSVPKILERSSRKIAKTLLTLSEVSFVWPYTKEQPQHIEDIAKVLETRLET